MSRVLIVLPAIEKSRSAWTFSAGFAPSLVFDLNVARAYFTSTNSSFRAPQIGHLSGASPTTVWPQTSHTWIGTVGRSLPLPTAAAASE